MTAFSKLSKTQLSVFEQICINNDAGHSQQTLRSLIRLGLIVEYHQRDGLFAIKRYRVPILVHMEWCQWASDEILAARGEIEQ